MHMHKFQIGIDWDGPVGATEDECSVSVPPIPSVSVRQQLGVHTDELFGVEHFVIVREIL